MYTLIHRYVYIVRLYIYIYIYYTHTDIHICLYIHTIVYMQHSCVHVATYRRIHELLDDTSGRTRTRTHSCGVMESFMYAFSRYSTVWTMANKSAMLSYNSRSVLFLYSFTSCQRHSKSMRVSVWVGEGLAQCPLFQL